MVASFSLHSLWWNIFSYAGTSVRLNQCSMEVAEGNFGIFQGGEGGEIIWISHAQSTYHISITFLSYFLAYFFLAYFKVERVERDNLNFPCSIYQSKLTRLNVQNFCGSPSVQIYCIFTISATISFMISYILHPYFMQFHP